VDHDCPLTLSDPETGLDVCLPARFLLQLLAAWKTAPGRWL
jgi:hypothetical protein